MFSPKEKKLSCERLKLLILMCQEDDDDTRCAAIGALATITSYNPELCKFVRNTAESWIQSISLVAFDQSPAIRHRALVFIQQLCEQDIDAAEDLVKSELKEIILGMSRNVDQAWNEMIDNKNKAMLSNLSTGILNTWAEHKLVDVN